MDWIATAFAILGALIVTSKGRRVRLWAFIIWFFTNTYWVIFATDPALRFLFGVYLALAILGVRNNWKPSKEHI